MRNKYVASCLLLILFGSWPAHSTFDDDLVDDEFPCAIDEFQCKNKEKCIWQGLRCDRLPDCGDNSDEENCPTIISPTINDCPPPNLFCDQACIPPQKICDGRKDCKNGNDELNCNKTTTNTTDQCIFGSCSQLCEKTSKNKFACKCIAGYVLMENGFNCQSNASDQPFLLFSNRFDIKKISLSHQSESKQGSPFDVDHPNFPLISHLRNAIALDFFYNRSDDSVIIFWSDITLDQIFKGRFYQGVLNDVQPVVSFGVWTAEGLSIDWIGQHIYWIDSQLGHILVSNFDGSMVTTIISGDMQNLRSVVVDPNEGLIFWSDWFEKNPRIERATMAGTQRKVLFNIKPKIVGGGWPNGLTADFNVKRLYWIDAKSDSIHSITYEGNDERMILKDPDHLAHPFAITVFEDRIYYSDWKSKNLYTVNKWDGSGLETVAKESIGQPFDVKVVHSSRQLVFNNPCLNHNCSHLCLAESSTRYRCACPYLFALEGGKNPRQCVSVNQTLIVATYNTISAFNIDFPDKISFPVVSTSRENITALGIYEAKSIIYWADSHSSSIYMLQLNDTKRTQPQLFTKLDAPNCYGITVDNAMGQIYFSGWSTNQKAWVKVASWDGQLKRTVISSSNTTLLKKPKDIVYSEGKLYWLDENRLFRSSATGNKLVELKLKDVDANATINAQSLSIDSQERLLWTQPHLNLTRLLDLHTMTVYTLRFENAAASTSLVLVDSFSGEFLFYDRSSGNLTGRYADEVNGVRLKNSTRLLRSNVHNLVTMKSLERDLLTEHDIIEEQGQCKSLGCQHFCLQSFDERKCACADGFESSDNRVCELPKKRMVLLNADNEFFWTSTDPVTRSLINIPIVTNSTFLLFQPRFFAFNEQTNTIYFVDTKLNELWETNLLTKENKKVFSGGVARLSSVAVDPASGYIYVSSYLSAMPLRPMSTLVQVLHPVLSDLRKDILYFVNDTISSLKIDSTNGYLFWTSLSGIGRSRLDGSDFFRVVKHNRFVSGFAIDQNNKRLLYLERAGNRIFSVDYDGSDLKNVPRLFNLTNNRQIIFESVLVEDDTLYFAAQKQLRSVRLFDGIPKNETNTLLFNMTSTVLEMHSRLKVDEKSKSACDTKNCEHFCFAQGQDKEPKCDCVFSQLNKDGRSCDNYSSFLAYATGSKLEFTTTFDEQPGYKNLSFGSEQNQKEVQSLKPIGNKGLRMPVALASDRKQKIIFVSDTQTEQILAIPYSNESATRWVLVDNVRRVEGLAFDSTNNNLYFSSDTSIQYINVKDLNETSIPRKSTLVLELDKADLVRGLDVDPCSSTIYFTNWRSDEPAIEKVNFNGSNRVPLITTKIETPNAVSIDHIAKKLYWLDAHLDKIERVDFDGKNREIVLSAPLNASTYMQSINFPIHPFGLAIYKHRLYYTDWAHRSVLSVDKLLGDDVTVHRTNLINRPMGLAIVAEDMPSCGSDACTQGKLSCDEKCVLDAEGHPSCDCNDNSFLNPDGHSCTLWVEKGCPEMTCKDSKGCYLMEQHCDGVKNCQDGSDESECLRPARDPCNENVCKNNGTCKIEDGIVRCYCTEEFSGMYCTHRKCEDFCLHGECKLDEFTGLPSCKCTFGWTGKHCSEKMDFCKDFCFNNGTCQEASNGVHCSCPTNFHGIRCQNCFKTNGDELACQNNGYCLPDRSGCRCVDGFNGDECQKDPCLKHPCLNGGLCKRRADATTYPYCKCPPKYEGLHCQLDFCETNPGYCKNGGVCVHGGSTKNADSDDIQCLCPDSFTGQQCEQRRSCSDYCLNGATCAAFKSNNFECHCAHGFYGHRCEHNYACKLDCAYGECVKQDNGSHICKCPKGISLITDYLGHKSCSQYTASNCSELDCGSNGECVELLQKSGSRPSFQCLCKDGWTGMLCEFPSCYNYCEKGSRCSVLDGHPYCTCEKGQFGARCNQRITDYNFLRAAHNRSMTIMLPAILIILAMVSVAYFAVLKKHGISFIGVQKQFQHTRMRNEETASEFQNPAFSNEDENLANELPSSHLIDGGNVYNDTIIRNGSSSKSNIEQFNLLSKT